MGDIKKRFLAGGIFALCVLSLVWTEGYRDAKIIGLSELVALIGAWTCLIWLWPDSKARQSATWILKRSKSICARAVPFLANAIFLILCAAALTTVTMILSQLGSWILPAAKLTDLEKSKSDTEKSNHMASPNSQDSASNSIAKQRLEEAKKTGGKDFQERVSRLEREWLEYVRKKSQGELIDYERLKSREEWIIEQIVNGR